MHIDKFLKLDTKLIAIDDISSVDYSELESKYKITIVTKQGESAIATELNAIECLMQLKPSALEGKRLRWAKRVWYIHNLIGHPVMQILAMFGFYKQAFWIHDVTVPKPTGFKKIPKTNSNGEAKQK